MPRTKSSSTLDALRYSLWHISRIFPHTFLHNPIRAMSRKCEEGIGINVGYAHYWTFETFLLFPYFQWLLV